MANHHRRSDEQIAQQEEALTDDPGFLEEIVRMSLQRFLETEMSEHLGAAPHERTDARRGQRNGYKPRTLRTRVGTLNLLVPQDREGTFSTQLFARYQRNEKALCLALMEMYVEGVSTRKVKDITQELCGTSFSKSLVSRLAGELDAELERWRSRPLGEKAYPYVFVDARYEKARVDHRIVSEGVLIVYGVNEDGYREILGVEVADTPERGHLPRAVPLLERSRPPGRPAGDLRRPPGARGGDRSPLSGGELAAVPVPLLKEPPQAGGEQTASGVGRGTEGCVRLPHPTDGPRSGRRAGGSVAREPPEGCRTRRRARRGMSRLPLVSGLAPKEDTHHQRLGEAEPGDKA